MSKLFQTDLSRKVRDFALYMALLPVFPNSVTNVDKIFLIVKNVSFLSFEFYTMLFNTKITKTEPES